MNSSIFVVLLVCLGLQSIVCQEHKPKLFRVDEKAKELILEEKKVDVYTSKNIEFWMTNPITEHLKECYSKMKPGESIDFVIDLAPSPSHDEVDSRCANSPIGLFLETFRPSVIPFSPSKSYFDVVQRFIEAVTLDFKPEWTHSIIYNHGRKFYIRGRSVEDIEMKHFGVGDFVDMPRNLKTMWPVPTNSKPEDSALTPILNNNLGRMTKLALWNRDNGLPTVLGGSQRSKAVYTIVITDGASGAKLNELTSDYGRTTVIDIGERRFASKLSWDEMKRLVSVITLTAPQELPMYINTIRNMVCWLITK